MVTPKKEQQRRKRKPDKSYGIGGFGELLDLSGGSEVLETAEASRVTKMSIHDDEIHEFTVKQKMREDEVAEREKQLKLLELDLKLEKLKKEVAEAKEANKLTGIKGVNNEDKS